MQILRKFLVGFLIFVVAANSTFAWFDDITDELDSTVIDFLQSHGIGESAQNFYPDRPVSLAEFLVMGMTLAGIENLSANVSTRFKDVPADAWFAGAVAKADALGLLGDFRGENLLPNRPLNRGEIVELGLKIFGIGIPTTTSDEEFGFRDVGKNHRLARFIFRAVKMSVIDPVSDTEFGITRRVDRAEAAEFFYNLANFHEGTTIVIQNGSSSIPGFPLFEAVWDEIKSKFLFTENIDEEKMLHSALKGVVDSLGDQYSEFYTPEEMQQQNDSLSGDVEGIGVYIEGDPDGRGLFVVAPIADSPAERVGLRAGDVITAVDGKSLAGMSVFDAAELTRGKPGTTALFTILRNSSKFDVSITREKVRIDPTTVEFRNGIAIVTINQFTSALSEDFAELADEITAQHPRGILLDLRNNGGGLVSAAVDLVGYFVSKNSLVATQEARAGTSENFEYRTNHDPLFEGIRTIVLVNRGTASASEIVAAALRDHDAASIAGEQTFGKGVVQEINFFIDGTALKLTIAHWLSPNRQEIQDVGIAPDYEMVDEPETQIDEAIEATLAKF